MYAHRKEFRMETVNTALSRSRGIQMDYESDPKLISTHTCFHQQIIAKSPTNKEDQGLHILTEHLSTVLPGFGWSHCQKNKVENSK